MNYLFLIQSINKIALIAFSLTLLLIVYEVILMIKGRKNSGKIKIPDFNPKYAQSAKVANIKVSTPSTFQTTPVGMKHNGRLIIIAILVLILFGLIALLTQYIDLPSLKAQKKPAVVQTELKVVESDGIMLFNTSWKKLEGDIVSIHEGDMIRIGVTRIRINSSIWTPTDETIKFNKETDVFYRDYNIASNASSLKIDAQLYSDSGGWLGE
jgi:hypothetical protein